MRHNLNDYLPISPKNQNVLQKSADAYCDILTIRLARSSGSRMYLLPIKNKYLSNLVMKLANEIILITYHSPLTVND
jgi:hypothetical protein